MKKLILIRHAEATEYSEDVYDFDRALTKSGELDAEKMATLLSHAVDPEILISSPALRAKTTANIFASFLNLTDDILKNEIYEANTEKLLKLVNQIDEKFTAVALVGHNPGISNLLYTLTGKITTMPTSSWVEIELEADLWAEVTSNSGILLQYQYP